MSYPATQRLGGNAFNHSVNPSAEQEYDRLRDLAHEEARKRSSCFDRAHQAYERGDGALAHQLSEEGKQHGAKADDYNKQASDYIFRENNATNRVADDTIDLHGQYVKEAEEILEKRIKYAQQQGQDHLHVIVGKGNHSRDHIQKIKPKVEEICRELGLQYATEHNEGRMYINLQGGPAQMPAYPQPPQNQGGGYQNNGNLGYQNQGSYNQNQGGYPGQQQGYQQQQQQGYQQQPGQNVDPMQQQMEEIERVGINCLKKCCVVM